jgi:hypothetical protein
MSRPRLSWPTRPPGGRAGKATAQLAIAAVVVAGSALATDFGDPNLNDHQWTLTAS